METPEHGSRFGQWIGPAAAGGVTWGVVTALLSAWAGVELLVAVLWGVAAALFLAGAAVELRRRREEWDARARWPLPSVPVALLAVTDDGRVAHLNRAAELVLGWAAADARGHRVEMLVPGLGIQGRSAVMRTLRGAAMGSAWTCRARHRDGSSVEVRVSATLDAPGPGRVYALSEVGGRDPAEVEAREARARLIEELATELKVPLNMASASCAMALDDARSGGHDALRGDLERIHGICARLQALACDLVDLARLQSGAVPIRAEDVELDPLLEAVVAQVHGVEGVSVEVEGDEGVVVRTDPQRLHRILFHLVDGAARGEVGAPARVEVQSATGTLRVVVRGAPVRDSGVGAELVTGLTELLGGTLRAASEAEMRLELPLDAGWGPASADRDATTAPLALGDDPSEEVVDAVRGVAS